MPFGFFLMERGLWNFKWPELLQVYFNRRRRQIFPRTIALPQLSFCRTKLSRFIPMNKRFLEAFFPQCSPNFQRIIFSLNPCQESSDSRLNLINSVLNVSSINIFNRNNLIKQKWINNYLKSKISKGSFFFLR